MVRSGDVSIPRRTRLRGRLLLAVVVAFLPLLALEAYLLDAQANTLRERVMDERIALARSEAQAADAFVAGNIRTLEALAQTRSIREPRSGDLDAFLRAVGRTDPGWLTLGLSAADGFNLSSLTTPPRSVSVADRDYFQGAIAGRPTVGTALIARALGAKSVIVAVPVELADGGKAVLSGALSLSNVETELRRALPTGIELRVVDRRGQMFIGPGIGDAFPVLTIPAVEGALRGEASASVVDLDGVATLVGSAGAPVAGWGVILREPVASAFAEIDRQRTTAFAISGAASLFALLLAVYFGLRLEVTYDAVETARERLVRVLDEMPVAVAIYDRSGSAVIRNAAYTKLLGGTPPAGIEETLRFYKVRTPQGAPLGIADHPTPRALRGETVRAEQVVVEHPDTGAPIHILVNALPFHDGEEIGGALVVFQDITALTELERERAAFFDMASHEIKTPLTALIGHLQLARRKAREGSTGASAELLERAERGGQRLAELVRDLLDTSRLEVGRLDLALERVDVGALAASVVDEVLAGLDRHEIALDRGAERLIVEGDPRRITQILQNLLDNAVRYSPAGGRIDVTVRRESGEAVVRVADRGIGIPADERAELFQRFFRTSRTQAYGGTGLGLFISRRIAEMHGGRLWLERTGPEGSVFALALPLAPDADSERGPAHGRTPLVAGG
jgi:signal transduction histidine kinase